MKDIFDKCQENERIVFARERGIYPYFHRLESKQDAVVTMQGREVIMLGSNNYLSLTNHPDVIAASVAAAERFGTGVSGSRFLNGTTTLHVDLERKIARFLGKEDCVVVSSGFNANLAFLSCIGGRSDVVFCDRENHASIYDGIKLGSSQLARYYHGDMADLENHLAANKDKAGGLIVTDGVFSMSGEICDLPKIVALAKKHGARVMVDDAHGLGVLGAHGRGTAEHFGLENEVDILMGTFSKSLASLGGYVAGPRNVIEYVRHASRPFIFAAALPPANLAAASAALDIIGSEPRRRENLARLTKRLRAKLSAAGAKIGGNDLVPIVPIYSGSEVRTLVICKKLFENGVYVNPVLPPATPDGDCLIRVSLQANLTEELVDRAAEKIVATIAAVPADGGSLL